MKEVLYLECYSGISGDMTVAALLDLGADEKVLNDALNSIKLEGFHTHIRRVLKSGIDALDFSVILDEKHENHDHDMEYLHGKINDLKATDVFTSNLAAHTHAHTHEEAEPHTHAHTHEEAESHTHEHTHEHMHEEAAPHTHEHSHRSLFEIFAILDSANATDAAKELAKKIFSILGQAEAIAHGIPVDKVHFHEVGAVDSIVDILAIAVCLDNLSIKQAVVPVLYEGTGFVRCQHGLIPIPVPAVLNIAKEHGLKLHLMKDKGEFVTPTGAAVVAAIKTMDELPENFKVKKVGIGAGKRTYEKPSLLRAMILEY